HIEETRYLINASGLGYDISKFNADFPLLRNLIEKGFMISKKYGGIVVTDCGQAINRDNHIQKNLICIGPTASYGHQFPTTYASFIAIDAIEKALKAINLSSLQITNESKLNNLTR